MGQPVDIPLRYWRWKFAEKFRWTLDYIDNLPMGELYEYIQIADGEVKAGHRNSIW